MLRNGLDATSEATTSVRPSIVVAGPSSSLTIPGIIVSQIVQSLSESNMVTRIDVDSTVDFDAGLHRSPSLAAAHHASTPWNVVSYEAPSSTRLRAQAFKEWISPSTEAAIAFAWPGLDNSWIRQFLAATKTARVKSMVVCVSLPRSNPAQILALSDVMFGADLVLVGNTSESIALSKLFRTGRPRIESHAALSLHGRAERSLKHQITAFLQRDSHETLATLLSAYDAIPEAWIDNYNLQIVMRYQGETAKEMVAASYHKEFVELNGHDVSSKELKVLCSTSSALIIADPAVDSRAYSIAVDCGVAVVVLAASQLPLVGHGYVGALLADANRPVSVHVALSHALRLAELHFPRPDAWNTLVERLLDVRPAVVDVVPPLVRTYQAG